MEEQKFGNRRCLQSRCSFNVGCEATGGFGCLSCPTCAICGAGSNVINQDCDTCIVCEGEDGVLRDGKSKVETQKVAVVIKNG